MTYSKLRTQSMDFAVGVINGYFIFKNIRWQKKDSFAVHNVVWGDTLWGLARKYLGDGARYPEIKELNGLTGDTIYVGQTLKIPN